MNVEKLFIAVIAIPFVMGFINTIINCAAYYMLQDAASFFLLIVMCGVLLVLAKAALNAVSGIFG